MTRDGIGFELLEQEILKAKAEALGRAGEKLRRALEVYAVAKQTEPEPEQLERAWNQVLQARETLVVLREGIGLRRHDSIDEEYGIPFRQPREARG